MTTYFPSADTALGARQWWVIDAAELPLGRVATQAARLLTGKHKATWTPFIDTGDFVVIVNCERAGLTGRKELRKTYIHHSGYPGGFKEIAAGKLRAKNPVYMVEEAVRGMLPKTRLGRAMSKKLKVYVGGAHPHVAQNPRPVDLPGVRRLIV
jgi:large subunit ribosomal protein L13